MSNNSTNDRRMVSNPVQDIQLSNNIFSGWREFQAAMKMAETLSGSTIVPKDYQNNPGNCLIALEMAIRLGVSPMMTMQNLYVVNGRPAWSSQYIVAMINNSHKYKTELQYHMEGQGDNLRCYAYAEDYNGHEVRGPEISIAMAKAEGWYSRNGSKWRTMPEVMIRYRAASFFGRLNCPDMIMGIYSADEARDMEFYDSSEGPAEKPVDSRAAALNAEFTQKTSLPAGKKPAETIEDYLDQEVDEGEQVRLDR